MIDRVQQTMATIGLMALCVAGGWTPADAQPVSDEWQVVVAPYLMGAAMDGTTTVRGREADVNVPASDIFSNLQFGAMGLVEAKKGHWGFGADVIWMALGTTVRNTNVDFNQGAFAFYGIRRLGAAADLTFGARVNTLQGEVDFKTIGVRVDQDQTWVDPIVGLTLRTPPDRLLQLRLYSEIGGFGAGSDFAWQAFPSVGLRLTPGFALELGYRWLDIDYASGEGTDRFAYDVLTQGPVLGMAFKF
jgi:hypothetical protein